MLIFIPMVLAGEGLAPDQVQSGSAPAFVFLGVETPQVEHPATPGDLSASLGNSFAEGSYLPRNLAVEVAPGWWGPNNVSIADYVEGGSWTWWRNIQVSAGSDGGGDKAWSGALAIRTTAWLPPAHRKDGTDGVAEFVEDYRALSNLGEGPLPEVKTECGRELRGLVEKVRALTPAGAAAAVADAEKTLTPICNSSLDPKQFPLTAASCNQAVEGWNFNPAPAALPSQSDSALAEIVGRASQKWKAAVENLNAPPPEKDAEKGSSLADPAGVPACAALLKKLHDGWYVEVAAGTAARSGDHTWNSLGFQSFGGWVSVTDVVAAKWSLSGTVRVLSHDWDQEERSLDAELMVGGIFTGDRYNLSVSTTGSYGLVGKQRGVGGSVGLDYMLQPGAWLTGSLGANYPLGEPVEILSGMSVNFAVGKNRPDGI